ncbi:Dam family site-specific DNA-(adenine-N6)-methyltransferase [Phascolarctobacterium sp.]|uniref:DNA adenine methylase n=1 Tax=Phascolarctobacterium sp. TaxID=2049039 RepID=UPI0030787FCA
MYEKRKKDKYIKSPLNYTGGKYKILAPIYEILPERIDTFVDLFAGGFNVGINANASNIICNDQINYIIELYKCFQEHSIETIILEINRRIKEFQLSQQNADGYGQLRKRYNESKDILDFFVLICFAFNHQIRFNNNHQFNTPFGRERSSYNKTIENNLIAFCEAIHSKNITFLNADFLAVDLSVLGKNDMVYCDPPYLISTGSYNDGKRGFKDWTDKEEYQLLSLLDRVSSQGVMFALSNVFYHKGQSNEILIEWSKKYVVNYIDKSYSNCSYHFKDRGAKTVEVLITNFERRIPDCQQLRLQL